MNDFKYDIFIKGVEIDLVCLNEEIAENSNWYNWFNDEENMADMQKHYFPNTKKLQKEFYFNYLEGKQDKLQLGIMHKEGQILIGVISLSNIDYINRKCEIGGIIGEKKYHNIKCIVEASRLIITHAFETLNLHKVYGGALAKEVAMLYKRILGFNIDGVCRNDIYKHGKYHDVYLISILREEYNKKK